MRAVSVAGVGSTRSGRHDGTAIDDSGDPSSRPCPQGRVPRHVSRDSRSGNDPGPFPPDVVEARSRPEPCYAPWVARPICPVRPVRPSSATCSGSVIMGFGPDMAGESIWNRRE